MKASAIPNERFSQLEFNPNDSKAVPRVLEEEFEYLDICGGRAPT